MKEHTEMDQLYRQITDHLVASGRRIKKRAGQIQDIGVLKANLTEEDLRIERELVDLIHHTYPTHHIYAEEEHDHIADTDDIWVIDPISGTAAFIAGLPHYGLVAAHVHHGQVVFAVVYDPSIDELFTANRGQGAQLNGQPIHLSATSKKIMLNLAPPHFGTKQTAEIWNQLTDLNLYRNTNSFAINYCWVAAGRFDGVVTLAKDSFTEFAGSFMIQEAGGQFSTFTGEAVSPQARHFFGGNAETYAKLSERIKHLQT